MPDPPGSRRRGRWRRPLVAAALTLVVAGGTIALAMGAMALGAEAIFAPDGPVFDSRAEMVSWVHDHRGRYLSDVRAWQNGHLPSGSVAERMKIFRAKDAPGEVFGWVTTNGVPAWSYGIAFDPDGVLQNRSTADFEWDGNYNLRVDLCTPIEGPWSYCRLY